MTDAASDLRGSLGASSRRQTAHEFVRDTLRHAILSGNLAGGTRLVQAELASELDVSTTPVREALRDLAAEGLIRLDPHRGAIVHEIDMEEMQEIYELRRILEPACARRAVESITDEELARAYGLQAQMDQCGEDLGLWVQLNRDFHALLTDASRSPRLIAILRGLRDSAAVYVGLGLRSVPEHLPVGNAEHHRLLAAFDARDPDAAADAILEHLVSTVGVLTANAERRQTTSS